MIIDRISDSNIKGFNSITGFKKVLPVASVVLGLGLPVALSSPAKALQVQMTPQSPRLGDTISVIVSLDNPENGSNVTVSSGQETYPAYEIAPNKYRAFIPTTPLEKPGRRTIVVQNGTQTRNLALQVNPRKFPVQRINLPPGKAGVKATELELRRAREFREVRTPEKLWQGAFLKPNQGRMTTPYGVRRYYNGVFANDYYHRGLDFAGASGSAVVAPAAGRVVLVGTVSQGFRVHGNVIGVDHGQGVGSIFMHLNQILVKEGDVVKPGQKIGTVGSTGASTGPHLHWGLYVNGKSIDPMPWLNGTAEK
ncbi:MAG: M23 family metallopeptidase [Calothrix sp. C42_A2020_038]|nr:M23 family metallopeptidase [Calothrix sp. C42_A2020_038]